MRCLNNNLKRNLIILIGFIFLFSVTNFCLENSQNSNSNHFKYEEWNFNKLKLANSSIFDGLYANYTWEWSTGGGGMSNHTFIHLTGNIFNVTWYHFSGVSGWDVNNQTRVRNNTYGLYNMGDGTHDYLWIFTNVSINDTVPITIGADGDHSFNVSKQIYYDLPGYGPIFLWELIDLTKPGGIAWYEKNSGLYINGTFYYGLGSDYYKIGFLNSNANFSIVQNNNPPTLENTSVSPTSGNQTTLFNFTVTYQDIEGIEPLYVNITINGTVYLMQQQNPLDINYEDGALFQYLTYFQPGTYNYSFGTADTDFFNQTADYILNVVEKSNDNSPKLNQSQVNPFSGYNETTLYNFRINYSDADNNEPDYVNITVNSILYSMYKKDNLDVNYMDGTIYELNTTTSILGNNTYYYNCSDGYFNVSYGPFIGPYNEELNIIFFDDFENGLINWENISGLWHLTDQFSAWPNPYYSENHSTWFGNEITGTYSTGSRELGNITSIPINLSSSPNAYLQFYHWREGENTSYDRSQVYISSDNVTWDLIYTETLDILPWQKQILNITSYSGNESVWIRFSFDTVDLLNNNYRGWLIDDIMIYTINNRPSNYAPTLSNELISPKSGNQSTLFNFSIEYTDIDNNFPDFVNLVLNGSAYSMNKKNPFDNDYVDGCIYQFISYLLPDPYNYSYYFESFDGTSYNSTGLKTDLKVIETNLFIPTLSDGQVNPPSGVNDTTIFSFTVNYTDNDNNAPIYVNLTIDSVSYPMLKYNISDNYYGDGCLYYYNLTFSEIKSYSFSFQSSDGINTVSDGPFSGPTVKFLVNYKIQLNTSFNWINTSGAQNLNLPDDGYATNNLPFNFLFFENFYSQIYICSNGIISFQEGYSGVGSYPSSLPTTNFKYIIALFPEDLDPIASPGQVYVKNLTNPNRCVIIYNDLEHYNTTFAGSFEIILYESGLIKLQYKEINSVGAAFAGVNRGGVYSFSTNYTGLNNSIINYSIDFFHTQNQAPQLKNSQISPNNGNQSTLITFEINYTDSNNDPSTYVDVVINGTHYSMNKKDILDNNYTDGCIYQFSNYFQSNPFNYTYYFECSDGQILNTTIMFSNLEINYTNLGVPLLINPQVTPEIGNNSTIFNFSVWYYDSDNNLPLTVNLTINSTKFQMLKTNLSDFYSIDGIHFYYLTNLAFGYYQFQINCSDGLYLNSTSWISKPEVNPFYGLSSSYDIIHINPLNNSLLYNDTLINFTWSSMEAPFGSVNYTFQISNQSDFSFILVEILNITETPTFSNKTVLLDLQLGQYFWRIIPVYDVFNGKSSNNFTFIIVPNDSPPTLTNITLNPLIGNQYTLFNFSINYTDTDNNDPSYIYLVINGTAYSMVKSNASDINYTDGCIYKLSIFLDSNQFNYSYYVNCSDGKYFNYTNVYNNLEVNHVNIYTPYLIFPQVTPSLGGNTTIFNFTVFYFDIDNDLPLFINITIDNTTFSMLEADFLDSNTTDGKKYFFNTTLDYDIYNFTVNCSDGIFLNTTGLLNGPEVNPFVDLPLISFYPAAVNVIPSLEIIIFNWTSLEPNFGNINYTLQISEDINFTMIYYEIIDIVETNNSTYYQLSVKLPKSSSSSINPMVVLSEGRYYWRLRPESGQFIGNWTFMGGFRIFKITPSINGIEPPNNFIFILILIFLIVSLFTIPIVILKLRKRKLYSDVFGEDSEN
jgi:hypothetical protein